MKLTEGLKVVEKPGKGRGEVYMGPETGRIPQGMSRHKKCKGVGKKNDSNNFCLKNAEQIIF